MKKEQRQRIVDRHRDSLKRHGYHPNALYWSSIEIQQLRFKILAAVGMKEADSLLDVGCGFADFKSWLEGEGTAVKYTGVDLSPDLLRVAQQKHPDAALLCGELLDFSFAANAFDWVALSGAMNEQLHDDGDYARKMIAQMYHISRKGIAFNMLDGRTINAHDLQSVEPHKMLKYCQTLCKNAALLDAYLANDFTIYMQK
ncbi:MAG: class I SAM-dependent methyltransferase [Mariprofundus sp.]|nr:class I SAM-dependent methyltransferase [Mariprofundus sp.]